MSRQNTPKKQPKEDWHRADIKAALEKAGWSLSSLSKHHGYKARCALKQALYSPWPKAELIIAKALKTTPQTIWPSRYPKPLKCTPKRRKAAA